MRLDSVVLGVSVDAESSRLAQETRGCTAASERPFVRVRGLRGTHVYAQLPTVRAVSTWIERAAAVASAVLCAAA